MKIGYASSWKHIKTRAQQRRLLREAGCAVIFEDEGVPGPELKKALSQITTGDILIVAALPRLAASAEDLAAAAALLRRIGAHLISLDEGIDTSVAAGGQVLRLLETFATLRFRTFSDDNRRIAAAAKARGILPGPKPALSPAQIEYARAQINRGVHRDTIAEDLGVAPITIYRALRRADPAQAPSGPGDLPCAN